MAAPLNPLLKDFPEVRLKGSKHPVFLDKVAQAAFATLISEIGYPSILVLPVTGSRYSIDTDASPHQIGVAFFQEDADGQKHPARFWSCQLTASEGNYSATEKGYLALVRAIQVLRPYFFNEEFDAAPITTHFVGYYPLIILSDV